MPQVTFDGHVPQVRTIEPTADDLATFKSVVRSLALDTFKYQSWEGPHYYSSQRPFVELCEKYGVNPSHKKDRVAFATALIDFI